MKHLLSALAAVCVLLCLPATALAENGCTEITTYPATITSPGKYCLAKDGTTALTAGALVSIKSNDVTLDCQQHTLKSTATSASGSSSAIYAYGRNNLLIENCRVIGGFTYGIKVSQDQQVSNRNYYNIIRNNVVAGPYFQGIVAFGSAVEVHGNRVYDIGGQVNSPAVGINIGGAQVGYRMQVVRENAVAGTNAPSSIGFGILSSNSQGTLINHNLVTGTISKSGNPSYAIMLSAGSGNTITDNVLVDAGRPDSVGISTPEGGAWCYDNQIRAYTATEGCDASLQNY